MHIIMKWHKLQSQIPYGSRQMRASLRLACCFAGINKSHRKEANYEKQNIDNFKKTFWHFTHCCYHHNICCSTGKYCLCASTAGTNTKANRAKMK